MTRLATSVAGILNSLFSRRGSSFVRSQLLLADAPAISSLDRMSPLARLILRDR